MLNRKRGNELSRGKLHWSAAAAVLALTAALTLSTPQEARADTCLLDTNADGVATPAADTDGGAANDDDSNLACGVDAQATGGAATAVGFRSEATAAGAIAIGAASNASSLVSTAIGVLADASGENAIAIGQIADASAVSAIAIGFASDATAPGATAVGLNANALGANSLALGRNARALGNGSSALGPRTTASGDFSLAAGLNAQATASGSTALGRNAIASLPDEFVMGTIQNTYTAPGITTFRSRSRQSGPLSLVTTDPAGHLASDGGAVFDTLGEVQAGVALAIAMESPIITGDENFAMRAGYGNFEGDSHAFGVSMVGSLRNDGRARWSWDAGFGAGWSDFQAYDSVATWGGRAGVQMAW